MILRGQSLRRASAWAQDLSPRAYLITPVHSNAVTLTYSFYDGGLNFAGTIPITGATGTYSIPIFTYYHSFNFFGRSANINASLPYGVGTFSGQVLGTNKRFTAPACWILALGSPLTSRAVRRCRRKSSPNGTRRCCWERV